MFFFILYFFIMPLLINFRPNVKRTSYGSVWNPESSRQRKKNSKENDFFMFGFIVENIKENQI